MDDSGTILAKTPGEAVVTGKVQITDPSTALSLIFSQDIVHVKVVKLKGIKMFVPSPRLLSGVDVSIYAYGVDGAESPFTFASAVPGLQFYWSVSNMDALAVSSVYDKAGVSIQEERDFDAQLQTRNPGLGTVRVTVKCPPDLCLPDLATFTDQVQIEVIPRFRLLRPLDSHFLLPHNGLAHIETNMDASSRLSYQLLNSCGGERGVGQQLVSVGEMGEVKAAAVSGHAVVMVTASEAAYELNQTLIVHVEVSQDTSRYYLEYLYLGYSGYHLVYFRMSPSILTTLMCTLGLHYHAYMPLYIIVYFRILPLCISGPSSRQSLYFHSLFGTGHAQLQVPRLPTGLLCRVHSASP